MHLTSLIKRVFRKVPETAHDQLSEIALGVGDVAIDCGANVGNITSRMAATGAKVFAFEPNPYAFEVLSARFAKNKNVHCINKGVLNREGRVRLYLHENAERDQVWWSTGSSVLAFKSNVNRENYVEIEVIDLASFIEKLDQPPKVLKVDIEGAECVVLNRLLDAGLLQRIEHVLVETHDQKIPELRKDMVELKARLVSLKLSNVDLTWI